MSGDEKIEHSDHVCETCNQPEPTSDPYRGSVPEDQVEEETPFSAIKEKIDMVRFFLEENTPQPIKWMFKSLGWVLVGSVVVSAGLAASFFLFRYILWALIVMLGKWLLDRIGRGIPRVVEMHALPVPHSDFGYWEVGALWIGAVVVFAVIGKLVMTYLKNRGRK